MFMYSLTKRPFTRGTQNHEKQRFSPPKTWFLGSKQHGFLMLLGALGRDYRGNWRIFLRMALDLSISMSQLGEYSAIVQDDR